MDIKLHENDLPADVVFKGAVAVDTEAMGLNHHRDRLCLVQLSSGDGVCHLVHLKGPLKNGIYEAPRLKALMEDAAVTKIFHFARFDMAALKRWIGASVNPVFCTKIASKLARTFTDRHSLKDLLRDQLGVDISKQEQLSDWGAAAFRPEQLKYAATDVLYLHALMDKLSAMLVRENRMELAHKTFNCLNARIELDLAGWHDVDIFHH